MKELDFAFSRALNLHNLIVQAFRKPRLSSLAQEAVFHRIFT